MLAYILLAVFILVVGFLIYWKKFRKVDKTLYYIKKRLVDLGIDPHRYAVKLIPYATPQGSPIFSTVPIPSDFLTACDEEAEHIIRNHTRKYPHWKAKVTDFKYVFVDPMVINQETEPGSPALLVTGYQTAGTVTGTNDIHIGPGWLVIPHQAQQEWKFMNYWRASVYNEGEHLMENMNDKSVFMWYAGPNDSHPHVPDESLESVTGFVSTRLQVSPPCAGAF